MNAFQTPYGQGQMPAQFNSFRQIQEMFPQPQGSVYSINTAPEIGNVPIGSTGLSVAICFPEEIMYIKSFQNGNPVIMAYRVTPYTREEKAGATTSPAASQAEINPSDWEERLTKIEQQLANLTNTLTSNNGGKFNDLL